MLREELLCYPELVRTEGLYQMARDGAELQKWQQQFAQLKPFSFPKDFLRLMSAEEAESKIGLKPRLGGLWHEGAGIVAVAEWVRARLNRSGLCRSKEKIVKPKMPSDKSLLKQMRSLCAVRLKPLIFFPESNFR